MSMFGLISCCVVFMLTSRITLSVPLNENRMRQLENQLFHIEEKIESEAKIRRESVKGLMNILYEFGVKAGSQNGSGQLPKENLGQDLGENQIKGGSQDTMVHALLIAFGDEKKNNRRIERDLQKQLETNVKRIQRDLDDLQTAIPDIIQSNFDILSNVEDLGKDIKGLKKSSENSSREILNRFSFLDLLLDLKSLIDQMFQTAKSQNRKFDSCVELRKNGFKTSGLYDIFPGNRATPLRVYCDQVTDGGGWVVFQRREDGTVNFYRNWLDYKFGFGNPEGEFWIGNEYLHLLTSSCCHELRIDMEDFENEHRYAKYSNFSVGSKATNYLLTVNGYTGDAGDSFGGHSGHQFSTQDKDNDKNTRGSCAVSYKGAWWYTKCHASNLNGQYLKGKHESYADGVNWYAWKEHYYSLRVTEMKLR